MIGEKTHGLAAERASFPLLFTTVTGMITPLVGGFGIMPFFANFRMHEGHKFRLDTRIYLRDDNPGDADICVAAVIGKNPGSANPTQLSCLSRISLDGDKLLPFVRNRFRKAYERAGLIIPGGAFVRVWNLVYICNPDLRTAVRTFQTVQYPLYCETEEDKPPFVWFAWGPPFPNLCQYKARFLQREFGLSFYYDMDSAQIVPSAPSQPSRVKHTQGLPAEPVEAYIATLVADRAS